MYRAPTRYEERIQDTQETRLELLEMLYELIVNRQGLDHRNSYKVTEIANALKGFADQPVEKEEYRGYGLDGTMTLREVEQDALLYPEKYEGRVVW